MFKKSLGLGLLMALMPSTMIPAQSGVDIHRLPPNYRPGRGKGQLRAPKGKPSGAAVLKRAAKKRNNINKRKGK